MLAHLWTQQHPAAHERPVCRANVRAASTLPAALRRPGDAADDNPRCPACLAIEQAEEDAAVLAATQHTARLAAADAARLNYAEQARQRRNVEALAALARR